MIEPPFLDEAVAARIAETFNGLHVHIPLGVIRKLDDLETAAFVGLAVYLSGCCKTQGGWFFFEQDKEPDPESESMFRKMGSWRHALGLGKDAQQRVRRRLEKLGLLIPLPSERQRKLGNAPVRPNQVAFIFEQVRGAPPRLHYKVDQRGYIAWVGAG